MFYSFLFDDPEDVSELSGDRAFVLLSQGGFLKCIEPDARLMPTVKSHLERRVIVGDRFSGIHYFFTSAILQAGRPSVDTLYEKLCVQLTPGRTTYNCLLAAQKVINAHFEEAIASLIDSIPDDDHSESVRVFRQITDIYTVLSRFQPRYKAHESEWRRKTEGYRKAFCKEKELVNVRLR